MLVSTTAFSQLIETPEVTSLMERWKVHNLGNKEMKGWRIQILATIDRRQMESARHKFENLYPDYPVHTAHNDPYFLLKTGAFLTLQKAQAFLKKLQRDYPSAITVTDMIKGDELLLYDQ
jgi:hypothetical protein